jgi:hypothetical protein
MNILFIDDTEQNKYVGIGGVIFQDDCLDNLHSFFNYRKALHNIPLEEEIKWSPNKNSWTAKNLIDDSRISAYSDILDLISLFKGKLLVSVFQRDLSGRDLREAKWKCIEFITERFQFYLQQHEDKKGLIISDFPGSGKEEKKLLQDYYQLLGNGTEYVKPENIVMNILTTESHLNPSLQIADLVVGITTSMCTTQRKYALQYWDRLKNNFHHSQSGKVMGCGLKVYPKDIVREIHQILFPEEIRGAEISGENYEEHIERMRYLYSVLMSKEELDIHFPRP